MAKRRFDKENNPAASYISGMGADQLEREAQKAEGRLSEAGRTIHEAIISIGEAPREEPDEVRAIIEKIEASNLSESDRAALSRLYEIGKEAQRREAQPKETKSKRLNLLIRPTVLADLKKIADAEGVSVNDLINSIVEDFTVSERGRRGLAWYRENREG